MHACGLAPKCQVLDNEASEAYKQSILDAGLTYQLIPPDDHRCNVAEKAIQTWKDHFIAILSGKADKFPLHLWCQLIPHMEHQLKILRQSNANPKISAYAHLYGPHDYNALPFVPLGMDALVHDKPNRRKTYAQHCPTGWVIGTSPEHYWCWKVWSAQHERPAFQRRCSSNTSTSQTQQYHPLMHSLRLQQILRMSLNTMPRHNTLGPKPTRPVLPAAHFKQHR